METYMGMLRIEYYMPLVPFVLALSPLLVFPLLVLRPKTDSAR